MGGRGGGNRFCWTRGGRRDSDAADVEEIQQRERERRCSRRWARGTYAHARSLTSESSPQLGPYLYCPSVAWAPRGGVGWGRRATRPPRAWKLIFGQGLGSLREAREGPRVCFAFRVAKKVGSLSLSLLRRGRPRRLGGCRGRGKRAAALTGRRETGFYPRRVRAHTHARLHLRTCAQATNSHNFFTPPTN
jgi:hypothetical protein